MKSYRLKAKSYPAPAGPRSGGGKLKATQGGQSLVEVLVAVAIGGLIIGSAVVAITLALRSNLQSKDVRTASFFLQEMVDNARLVTDGSWHDLYNLDKTDIDTTYPYHIVPDDSIPPVLVFFAGEESVSTESVTFTRYFTVENVCRDDLVRGAIAPCGTEDPSTQKVTGFITWPNGSNLSALEYFTRTRNQVERITDWSDPASYDVHDGLDPDSTPGEITLE